MRMTPICYKTKVTAKRFSVRHLCLGLVDPEEGGIVGGNLIRIVRLPKLSGLFWRTKPTFSFQKSRKCFQSCKSVPTVPTSLKPRVFGAIFLVNNLVGANFYNYE